MKKALVSTFFALSFVVPIIATAQAYYGGCVTVPAGLSLGMRSSSVLSLQTFLVAQNYPGGGSWMLTGYFGQATLAALKDFQWSKNVQQTGSVDAATAAAITSATCGGSAYVSPMYVAPAPTYPSYSSYLGYPYYGGAPVITSLSQNTGYPGQSVTVYGVGFDPYNNTVIFNGTSLTGISSSNGTSLTFTIPSTNYYSYSYAGTQVQLSILNSHGTSNNLSFTLYGTPYGCGTYPYNNNCNNCSYPYLPAGQAGNYGSYCQPQPNNNYMSPTLSYLSPSSGGVGTTVTVYGSGFTTSGNTVRFGTGIITGLNSSDGYAVSFTVPSYLTGYGSQPITLSTYQVSVTNGLGYTTGSLPFTVTSYGSGSGAPTITSVTGPTTLAAGSQGIWTVYVNNQNNQYLTFSVNWGDQNVYPMTSAQSQNVFQTNTLTHTYYQSGTYTITFTVSNNVGQSNTYTTTVAVGSGTYGNVSLNYLSPQSARVGTQILIQGTGFTSYDNTVHFGSGGTQHVQSQSGTTIYYTIPYAISPCDLIAYGCGAASQLVTPGSYPIYVSNVNGSSNTLTFTVVQ